VGTGWGYKNTGNVFFITNKNGNRKRSIYQRTGMGLHALIPVSMEDLIVGVYRHHDEYTVNVYKIIDIQDT